MTERDRRQEPSYDAAPERDRVLEGLLRRLGRDLAEESSPDPKETANQMMSALEAALREPAQRDSAPPVQRRREATVLDLAFGKRTEMPAAAERRRRNAPAAWAAAACALALALWAGWSAVGRLGADAGRLLYAEGELADAYLGQDDYSLRSGQVVATGFDGFALARMDGKRVDVALAPKTRFRVDSAIEATLEEGEAWLALPENSGRFVVATPQGRVEVLGTEFGVTARPGETEVFLLRGSVRLVDRASGDERLIAPGERVSLAANGFQLVDSEANAAERSARAPDWVAELRQRAQIAAAARYLPSGSPPSHKATPPSPGTRP